MRPLNDYDCIAAFQLAIWCIYLIVGIYLCTRHGFTRSSGWVFLVLLALVRIIGASMRLATLNDPTNVDLYVGWAVCSGLGLAMLVGLSIGIMSRLLTSVRRANGGHTLITPMMQRLSKLVAMAAMILFIVGGTQADWKTSSNGQPDVQYPTLSKVGISLMIGILVFSIFEALYLTTMRGWIPKGEKRILGAVYLAMPFVTLRLIYSCIVVYGGDSPSQWFSLGMEVLTEVIAAAIFEIMGLTLQKEVKDTPPQMERIDDPEAQYGAGKQGRRFIGGFR